MQRPRILVADDHEPARTRMCELLAARYEIAGSARDGGELLDEAGRLHPDVLVVDIAMPVLNGVEAAKRYRRDCPDARIVFVTSDAEAAVAEAILAEGPAGLVYKCRAAEELADAVAAVLRGETYISPRCCSS